VLAQAGSPAPTQQEAAFSERLLRGIQAGERRALAQSITFAENQPWPSRGLISQLYRQKLLGQARVFGITGPPGAGKSSLTSHLVKQLRATGQSVGVILIDPSSPFSGGALLGDRVRMNESTADPGVFIRSMGSRGHLGGLSLATQDAMALMDAFGLQTIIIETVGIGQAETDIVRTADLTVVLAVPGLGDEIQIIKAGIMEIGDVFVVNKADRDGAERVVSEIGMMLDMAPPGTMQAQMRPAVLRTVANRGQGVTELLAAMESRLALLRESGLLDERRLGRLWQAVLGSLQQQVGERLQALLQGQQRQTMLAEILAGDSSPFGAAQKLLNILERGVS